MGGDLNYAPPEEDMSFDILRWATTVWIIWLIPLSLKDPDGWRLSSLKWTRWELDVSMVMMGVGRKNPSSLAGKDEISRAHRLDNIDRYLPLTVKLVGPEEIFRLITLNIIVVAITNYCCWIELDNRQLLLTWTDFAWNCDKNYVQIYNTLINLCMRIYILCSTYSLRRFTRLYIQQGIFEKKFIYA